MSLPQTTITNTAGYSRYFTYILPHGAMLANNASVTVPYDLVTALTPNGTTSYDDSLLQSLIADVAAGDVVLTQGANAGAKTASVAKASTTGDATFKTTVLTLDELDVTMTDGGANGSIGSVKLFDFPQGLVAVDLAVTDLTVEVAAGIGATATFKHALGTAAEATNDTLDSTQANILPSTNTTLADSAGTAKGVSTTPLIINGTSSAGAVYLNFGVADAGSTANSTATVSGTVKLVWKFAGDN